MIKFAVTPAARCVSIIEASLLASKIAVDKLARYVYIAGMPVERTRLYDSTKLSGHPERV